jgi:hypothetical protein
MLSSCLTVSRIQRNCDAFAAICTVEKETVTVYRDTTIYRTDTIRVPLPRDTVRITDTITIKNNQAFLKPVHKEFGIIGVDAWVNFSVLGVQAYLTDSTILHVEKDTIYLEKVIKETGTTKTVKVRHIPGIYRFAFWILLIQAGAIIAWLVKQRWF